MSKRDCNDCSNVLRRDGTSQKERLFEEQQTDYVLVDERSYIDLIQFALRYSEKVQFWDVLNKRSGDWVAFMNNSQAAVYTKIANAGLDQFLTAFDLAYDTEFTSPSITREKTIQMMESTFSMATLLEEWLSELDSDLDLFEDTQNIIQRQAKLLIKTLMAYDNGADLQLNAGANSGFLSAIDYTSLSDFWDIDPAEAEINESIFVDIPALPTIALKGTFAKRHFRVLFKGMLDIAERLKVLAEEKFNEVLEEYSKHEPHFALFLTFIQLFKHAQDHINQFTEKHLNFYYRDVLQLSEKSSEPDSAHLIIEPAKNVNQKKIDAGTTLKAGQDENGVEINFVTDKETIINKASVAELKSIYLDRGNDTKYIQTIYHADKANSKDGKGKGFSDENAAWEPFGKTQTKNGALIDDQTMEAGRIGFSIASPELLLGEGKRKLTITIVTAYSEFSDTFGDGVLTNKGVISPSGGSQKGELGEFLDVNQISPTNTFPIEDYYAEYGLLLEDWFSIRLSGENGWIVPDNLDNVGRPVVTLAVSGSGDIQIEVELSREQDPVVSHDVDLHQGNYRTEWPVLEVLFDQGATTYEENPKLGYEFLKNLRINGIKIDCDVSGVANLKIGNDTGGIDPKKPFMPFTSNPQVGSNFYIGSREVFSKRLTYMALDLDWKGVPEAELSKYYEFFRKGNGGTDNSFANTSRIVTNSRADYNTNSHFTAQIQFLEDYGWKDLSVDKDPQLMHESSELALKQSIDVRTVKLLFFLMAIWQTAKVLAEGIRNISLQTIQPRKAETFNYVNLFRSDSSSFVDEGDARLPQRIEIESQENGNLYSPGFKTNFDLLTVDPESDNRYQRDPYIGEIADYSEGVKRGYIKLELNNDFFHAAYPKILTERAIKQEDGVPSAPYTPELHKVSLDYKSTYEVSFDDILISWDTRVEQFYHVTPFGEVEVMPTEQEKSLISGSNEIYYSDRLLPQLFKKANDISDSGRLESKVDPDTGRVVEINLEETSEGSIFIGLQDFVPPQTLSLLFQFKEGTEDNDLEVPSVEWSYMSKDQWVRFENSDVISDETNGLINSGIIEFSVPEEATNDNIILTNGLHWIRAQVGGNTEAFSDLIAVHAQAIKVTYAENGNDPYRLNTPIEPSSISKLVNKDFEIKKINQPYSSFGGRIEEQSTEYYTRVAERLRHKQRGITIRDYEHLVLEEFPEIFKTKCINHTSRYSEYAPGSVSVIVIPYFKNQNEKNPFELKVSKAKLNKIRKFLVRLNSPFVNLDVRNPKYETIQVVFGVEFHIGYDRTFYVKQLNEEIKEFISPWAFGKEEDIIFGGRINRSTILNFIEERAYVDFVTHFTMFHKEDENRAQTQVFIAEGTTASSVLVTALDHIILPANCDSTAVYGSSNYAFDHDSYNDSYN